MSLCTVQRIFHGLFIFCKFIGRSTLVGQHPMKSLSSVCPPLIFLKIGSLVFSDIVHNDSWPWYLVTDEASLNLNLGQISQNRTQNQVFCHFLKFDSLVFLGIAYNDSLQQCLTSSRGKTHKNNWGVSSNLSPEIRFFAIFSSLIH